jgi:hypothetical protein
MSSATPSHRPQLFVDRFEGGVPDVILEVIFESVDELANDHLVVDRIYVSEALDLVFHNLDVPFTEPLPSNHASLLLLR